MNRKLKNEELDRLTVDEFKEVKKTPLIVVLDDVRSLNNIGSVFRTSDAFLVEAIYLCGITAQPPHREINKTALGATETVNWVYFPSIEEAILKLKANNYKVASIEQAENSVSLSEFNVSRSEKYAIILGNEVIGVSEIAVNMSDTVIELSQFGTKHSLNISVCCGIVVWEFFNKLYK